MRYQLHDWSLLYSTMKHGISLNTFYTKVFNKGPNIIIIEDSKNYVSLFSAMFRMFLKYLRLGLRGICLGTLGAA